MRAALLFPFVLLALSARAAEPVCPANLDVDEKAKHSYAGWTEGREDNPHVLARITIFEGNPKDQASLEGDQRKTSKTATASTWKLETGTQYWMACYYAGTRVMLSRPIPANYRSVVITYDAGVSVDGAPEIRKVEWR
jgi:hypothetical protein